MFMESSFIDDPSGKRRAGVVDTRCRQAPMFTCAAGFREGPAVCVYAAGRLAKNFKALSVSTNVPLPSFTNRNLPSRPKR